MRVSSLVRSHARSREARPEEEQGNYQGKMCGDKKSSLKLCLLTCKIGESRTGFYPTRHGLARAELSRAPGKVSGLSSCVQSSVAALRWGRSYMGFPHRKKILITAGRTGGGKGGGEGWQRVTGLIGIASAPRSGSSPGFLPREVSCVRGGGRGEGKGARRDILRSSCILLFVTWSQAR